MEAAGSGASLPDELIDPDDRPTGIFFESTGETGPGPWSPGEPVDPVGFDPDDDGLDEPEESEERRRSMPFWLEVPLLMALALVIAVVIKTFLIQAFFIPSGSMEDTLEVDDRILVNKLAFRFGDPARGDVVVFDSGKRRDESLIEAVRRNLAEAIGLSAPESDFIKRIVGLPGEEIEIRRNRVFIDGDPLEEPYLRIGTDMPDFGPERIPANHYFMMGDHRNLSSDSRSNGPVHSDRFVGRAFVIVWPPGSWGGL
jgi:signal peptidase I